MRKKTKKILAQMIRDYMYHNNIVHLQEKNPFISPSEQMTFWKTKANRLLLLLFQTMPIGSEMEMDQSVVLPTFLKMQLLHGTNTKLVDLTNIPIPEVVILQDF